MGVVADEEDEVDEDVLKVECTNKGRRATRARDAAREEERNMVGRKEGVHKAAQRRQHKKKVDHTYLYPCC